jgi:Spy/CpxP family protein refolding chaperone
MTLDKENEMRATTRSMLSIGAAITVAVMTAALAGAHPQNTGDGSGQPSGRGRGGPMGRFGGPGGRGGPGGPMMGLGPIMRLNLSDAQRDQVKGIVESHRDEHRAVAERARAAHDALEAAVTADQFDEGTVRARSAEVASVDADIAVAQARLRTEVVQILTADQRAQLNKMEIEMRARRREHAR